MVYKLLGYSALIFVVWILNMLPYYPLVKKVGTYDAYSKKVVSNGNNILASLLGMVGVAISWYFFTPLRWIILIFYGLAILWELVNFLLGVVMLIIAMVNKEEYDFTESILVFISDILIIIGSGVVLYCTLHYLFEWI